MKIVDTLFSGAHNPNSKMCVMEAAAYVAGEKWSDAPECVSPTIGSFMRNWNDSLPDDASRTRLLAPLLSEILGTRGSPKSELTRGWMAFDWLARECGPTFMELTESLKPHAKALRDLGPIYDKPTLDAATLTINFARSAATAARAAAGDSAGAAARDAAWDAAWDAARAAAWDALAPTVLALQESATDLVKRMAEVERVEFEIKQPLTIGELVIR